MDEQILLSDYREVTEVITMVGGGDDGTQVFLSIVNPDLASSGLCKPA